MQIERFGGVGKDINPAPAPPHVNPAHTAIITFPPSITSQKQHPFHNARIILSLWSKPHLLPRITNPQLPLSLHRRTQTNRRSLRSKQFVPLPPSLPLTNPIPLPSLRLTTLPRSPLVLNRPTGPLRHPLNLHQESPQRKQHHQPQLQHLRLPPLPHLGWLSRDDGD